MGFLRFAVTVVMAVTASTLVLAEPIIETWRSSFGECRSVAVDPEDGSVWVAAGASVVHLSREGTILALGRGFGFPSSVSLNASDGSCWVADAGTGEVVHLSADGLELWRGGGFGGPESVSVNAADGSCWIADTALHRVVHLSSTGGVLWEGGDLYYPASVSVSPDDGSCWVADTGHDSVVRLAADGSEVWRGTSFRGPRSVAAGANDGSCWVSDTAHHQVVRLAASGAEACRVGGFDYPESVSARADDGSCWVADTQNHQVVHLSAAGVELFRGGRFEYPQSVAVAEDGGSCWVADSSPDQLVHLAADGTEQWRGGGIGYPCCVSADLVDGSCWVADASGKQVAHFADDGTELGRGGGIQYPHSVSADARDASCWVADTWGHQVVHLAADGAELWRGGVFSYPYGVSVNATDGSCWVADTGHDEVAHLSATGAELWRGGGFSAPRSVSTNAVDGSCWVADTGHDEVAHLSATGVELWRDGGFSAPRSVSANAGDGSCWVADTGHDEVAHLSATGAELWRGGGFGCPYSVAVNATNGSCWIASTDDNLVALVDLDGQEQWRGGYFSRPWAVSASALDSACWVADTGDRQVVRIQVAAKRFADVTVDHWAYCEVEACYSADIVRGYGDGTYGPDGTVTRDQMAVYIARALASGEENVPDPDCSVAPFTDVPCDHWARKHIAYCVDQGVVQGYQEGDYRPGMAVTRDQMAVYMARAMVAPTGEAALTDYVPSNPRNFPDVASSFWSYRHIEYCVENGVVKGYEDGLYHPEWTVTRDQMAVYVARSFHLAMPLRLLSRPFEPVSLLGPYPDQTALAGPAFHGRVPIAARNRGQVEWTLVGAPAGMTADSRTGRPAWENPAEGLYTIVLRATAGAESAEVTWHLRVVANDFPDPRVYSTRHIDFVAPRDYTDWMSRWEVSAYVDTWWEWMQDIVGRDPTTCKQVVRYDPDAGGGAHSCNPVEAGPGWWSTDPIDGWSMGVWAHEVAHNFNAQTNVGRITGDNWADPYFHHLTEFMQVPAEQRALQFPDAFGLRGATLAMFRARAYREKQEFRRRTGAYLEWLSQGGRADTFTGDTYGPWATIAYELADRFGPEVLEDTMRSLRPDALPASIYDLADSDLRKNTLLFAILSAVAGTDLRGYFGTWGFDNDAAFFDQVLPVASQTIADVRAWPSAQPLGHGLVPQRSLPMPTETCFASACEVGEGSFWTQEVWGGSASFSYSPVAHSGLGSLSTVSVPGVNAAWVHAEGVRPQSYYLLSAWVKTDNLVPLDGLGAWLDMHPLGDCHTIPLVGTSDWTKLQAMVYTGDVADIEVNCILGGWGLAVGQAWYDDIELRMVAVR